MHQAIFQKIVWWCALMTRNSYRRVKDESSFFNGHIFIANNFLGNEIFKLELFSIFPTNFSYFFFLIFFSDFSETLLTISTCVWKIALKKSFPKNWKKKSQDVSKSTFYPPSNVASKIHLIYDLPVTRK